MTTFFEASQARIVLKMKLIEYAWYKNSSVVSSEDGFEVLIGVSRLNNMIRKKIPTQLYGVNISAEID
jgi:hypothetical protein